MVKTRDNNPIMPVDVVDENLILCFVGMFVSSLLVSPVVVEVVCCGCDCDCSTRRPAKLRVENIRERMVRNKRGLR